MITEQNMNEEEKKTLECFEEVFAQSENAETEQNTDIPQFIPQIEIEKPEGQIPEPEETAEKQMQTDEKNENQPNIKTAKVTSKSSCAPVLKQIKKSIESGLSLLQTTFDTKIKADAQKDKLLDEMHSELAEYKNDMYAKIFSPLLYDIINLREDMRKLYRDIRSKTEEEENARLLSILKNYSLDIADLIEKYGVEIYSCEGDDFVPVRQRAVKIINTDEPEKTAKIHSRLSYGYALNGKILRPENVVAYRFTPQKEND